MIFNSFRGLCLFFNIICSTIFVKGHETEFLYSNNDFNVSNAIEMGRTLEGYILGIIPYISFEKCIEECLSRRRCLSLNYKQQFPICELNYETKSEDSGKTFTVSKGTMYTEATEWRKSMRNRCSPEICKLNERCILSESGQVCQISDCHHDIPKVRCAEIDKSQGISIHSKVTYSCGKGFKLIGRSSITCQPNGEWSKPRCECKEEGLSAFDCNDLKKQGINETGVYKISPLCTFKSVRCDMQEEGGGWTVLSRRIDDGVNFNRSWKSYKNGFGNSSRNYWIGNDYIHALTKDRSMDLLFILESETNGEKHKFKYKHFKIGNEASNFTMTFNFYPEYLKGDSKDNLPYKQLCNEDVTLCHNNTNFSTYNKDHTGKKCPQKYGGGWWYNECHHVSLTGDRNLPLGYRWKYLNGLIKDEGLLKTSVMMIRPPE